MSDIKVIQPGVIVKKNKSIGVTPTTNVPIEIDAANRVIVSPRSYHIVSPDIYTMKRNSDIDPWLEDQITNIVNTGDLASDVGDLNNRFENFVVNEYSNQIIKLENQDEVLLATVETLTATTGSQIAGIQNTLVVHADEFQSKASMDTVIGSWMNSGAGGAWFNSNVSTVSNVAYSAAKSASALTATMQSQKDSLLDLAADIEVLEKQIDGKVETWFYDANIEQFGPVDSNLNIDITKEPYASWFVSGVTDDRALHTGDTYMLFAPNVGSGNNDLVASYRFAAGAINMPFTDAQGYSWSLVTDDTATKALAAAVNAQSTADGKITTFYQDSPPSSIESNMGDLWFDSDDENKLYLYRDNTYCPHLGMIMTGWCLAGDKRISASVTRLDEATVDVANAGWIDDGHQTDPDIHGSSRYTTRAKSSLTVDANGSIAGFVAEATGDTSNFKIFADIFTLADSTGNSYGAPFTIDNTVTPSVIRFNGAVSFSNVDGDTGDLVTKDDLIDNTTVISGGNIRTGEISALRFAGNTVWADGSLRSSDYSLNAPYTAGFLLESNPSAGNPNIYGAHIKGGYIQGTTIDADVDITTPTVIADNFYITAEEYSKNYCSVSIISLTTGVATYNNPATNYSKHFYSPSYSSGYNKARCSLMSVSFYIENHIRIVSGYGTSDSFEPPQYSIDNGPWITASTGFGTVVINLLNKSNIIFKMNLAAGGGATMTNSMKITVLNT